MPTDQHLDTVGLLKAKVEGEIARLEPSIADRENYDDTRVRLHVKAEALRWVLREIEALPPVGVGEEKGMGSCDSASPTRYQSDEAPLPSIAETGWAGSTPPADVIETAALLLREFNDRASTSLGSRMHDVTVVAEKLHRLSALLYADSFNQNGGLSSATDNGSATPLGHDPKTPSPTPLGAEDLERAAKKRLLGYVFEACQPSHGDVFGWIDDHADEMIRAALNLPVEPGQ